MDFIVATLVERNKFVHQVIREEIAGLGPEQLGHVSAPGTNSLAVLITHLLGSERRIWSMVAGRGWVGDRASEFVPGETTSADLLEQVAAADRLLDDLAPTISADALAKRWERPGGDTEAGAYWLINGLGHGREHLAQVQLTKQLFPDVYPPIAHPM